MLAKAWRWFLALVMALMTLGLAGAIPAAGAGPACGLAPGADCSPAMRCEGGAGGCQPDPVWTYTAPDGYVTCQVIVKASVHSWVFATDGCQGNLENPFGYCVSGLGTQQVTVSRTCGNLPHCHAISHAEPWINAVPTAVRLSAVDVAPVEWSPMVLFNMLGAGLLCAGLLALAHWYRTRSVIRMR